jgi:nitroreductase
MDTWDAIRARRNVRTYKDEQLPEKALDLILEAAWRSPSSNNEQRWEIVLCTEREQLRQLARAWTWAGHLAGAAAAVVLLAPPYSAGDFVEFDLGQMAMSVTLMAADLGIGSCHSAVGEQGLVRSLLGYPKEREALAMISLGYPAGRPLRPISRPIRRPFDEVVHRGSW